MATIESEKTSNAATQATQPPVTLAAEGNAAEIAASTAVAAPFTEPVTDEKATESKVANVSTIQQLWKFAQEHSHDEVWGVQLSDPEHHIPSQIVFQKYLNANDGDIAKAKDQLKSTLDYRAKMNVSKLVAKQYSKEKFGGLGYITNYDGETMTPETREVFTWNIYGNVKDIQKSFGDMDAFIEWRVALMEMAMQTLDLSSATKPITAENDPYKIYQVHDYKSVSFFRSPPAVRAAAKKTVEVLAMAYPETLKEKFFVNVPGKLYRFHRVHVTLSMLIDIHSCDGFHVWCHETICCTKND